VILPEMIQELNFSRAAGGSIFNSYLIIYLALCRVSSGFLALGMVIVNGLLLRKEPAAVGTEFQTL
jgi:hypothetical protein